MELRYIDAHTHVQFAAFAHDYREVISRALAAGVGVVNVGTQLDTSRRAVELAHEYEDEPIYATVGLHPIHTSQSYHDSQELGDGGATKGFTSRGELFDRDRYLLLARDPKVVAIGECGFDYFRVEGEDAKAKQEAAFVAQIALAYEIRKPLMIHCRGTPSSSSVRSFDPEDLRSDGLSESNGPSRNHSAFGDLVETLTTNYKLLNTKNPGIVHFFSGSVGDAEALLELGFSFTFGGVITFTRDYDAVVKAVPLDRILSETDAPYVAPVPYRGRRNEPVYLVEVVRKLAELKGVPVEEMASQTLANARRVFRGGFHVT